MNKIIKLALRNLTRQKRRNVILAVAIAFGFFIVTTLDGLTSGIVANLEDLITQIEGGTVLIGGYEKIKGTDDNDDTLVNIIRDKEYISDVVARSGISYKSVSRFTYSTGQLIFNGKKLMSIVYGRDFAEENNLFDSFTVLDGSKELMLQSNGIIITETTAKTLSAQVGDSVFYSTTTIYGQNTVEEFIVAAIVKGNNFFSGMTAYVNIQSLNKIVEIPEDGYSTYTIYLSNKNDQEKSAYKIESMIRADGIPVCDRMAASKSEDESISSAITSQFSSADQQWDGTKYSIKTLKDVIPMLYTVLTVVHIGSTVILFIILTIIMIGISNTYRMVLYERIREIGTMRALGMTGKDTGAVFTAEALILSLIGAITGFVLSVVVSLLLCNISIQSEAIGMFLHNGHLTFKLSPLTLLLQYGLIIVLTIIAVSGSAKQASNMSPAEALRTVK